MAAQFSLANFDPADRLPIVPGTLHGAHLVVLVLDLVFLIDQIRVGSTFISILRTVLVIVFVAALVVALSTPDCISVFMVRLTRCKKCQKASCFFKTFRCFLKGLLEHPCCAWQNV